MTRFQIAEQKHLKKHINSGKNLPSSFLYILQHCPFLYVPYFLKTPDIFYPIEKFDKIFFLLSKKIDSALNLEKLSVLHE